MSLRLMFVALMMLGMSACDKSEAPAPAEPVSVSPAPEATPTISAESAPAVPATK